MVLIFLYAIKTKNIHVVGQIVAARYCYGPSGAQVGLLQQNKEKVNRQSGESNSRPHVVEVAAVAS